MKQLLATISQNDRQQRSLAACDKLIATPEFKNAQTIMMYLSMPSEIDTSSLALQAWQQNKRIAVPRISNDWSPAMAIRGFHAIEIQNLHENMQQTSLGTRQPINGRVVTLREIDLIIIPGLAFDHHGNRLGRGGGFYDRFLAQPNLQACRCAICFHEQLLTKDIPHEPHDVPMNLIVTDLTTEFTPGVHALACPHINTLKRELRR